MSLKKLFFNASFFKSNIKRFWWISVGYLVLFLTFGLLILIDSEVTDGFVGMNVAGIIGALIVPVILFSYLNSSGAVSSIHAFPIKRRVLFVTNIKTLYFLLVMPAVICYTIAIFYSIFNSIFVVGELLELFTLYIIFVTICGASSTLASMVTGNSIAGCIFSALLFGFPYYTEAIVKSFLALNINGLGDNFDVYTVENLSAYEINSFMGICFILGILIFVLSWFLYKKRKLEANGDIIAHKFLKPVFIGCVSFYLGLLGYFYLGAIYENHLLFILPFGFLGFVVSFMLSKKAFSLKGILKPLLIFSLCTVAFLAVVKFDLTGYEKRIPEIDDIESVNITNYTKNDQTKYRVSYYSEGKRYWTDSVDPKDFSFTEKEQIQNVMNLHKYLIDQGYSKYGDTLPILYTLKNGKTLKREYKISYIDDQEFLEPVYNSDLMKKIGYDYFAHKDAQAISIEIMDDRLKTSPHYKFLTPEDEYSKKLLKALELDIEDMGYEDIVYRNHGTTSININYIRPMVDDENRALSKDEIAEKGFTRSTRVYISKNHKRTYKLLEELGLFENIVKPENIDHVEIRVQYKQNADMVVSGKEQIKALYDFYEYQTLEGSYRRKTKEHPDGVDIEARFCDKDNNMLFGNSFYVYEGMELPQVLQNEVLAFFENDGRRTPNVEAVKIEDKPNSY